MKRQHLIIYGSIFLLSALVCPWIGSESLDISDIWDSVQGQATIGGSIFWNQRIPRVLLGLLAGGTLAVVGAAFQVLFRNPLVEPFTLGISGGSALGAFLAITIPSLWVTWGPFSSIQLFGLIGASLTLGFIYIVAHRQKGMTLTLLLAGITVTIICNGSILLLTYLSSPKEIILFQRWMMGGIDIVGFNDVISLLPLLFLGLGLLFYHVLHLNHIALGEELALGHGIPVRQVQRDIFIGGACATASVVSVVGPISFVGLIIPHAVRKLSGYDQRIVLPGCFFLGGSVLAIFDTIARTLIAPTELPVGILTAVIGGPLFIQLLVSRARP